MSDGTPKQGKRPAPRTAFKPGQSGNPGGKPKELREVVALARSHAPESIERLAFWMRSNDPKASVAAANAILNRGYGMPNQTHDIQHNLSASAASDAALLAIAIAGGGAGIAQAADQERPDGVVH